MQFSGSIKQVRGTTENANSVQKKQQNCSDRLWNVYAPLKLKNMKK